MATRSDLLNCQVHELQESKGLEGSSAAASPKDWSLADDMDGSPSDLPGAGAGTGPGAKPAGAGYVPMTVSARRISTVVSGKPPAKAAAAPASAAAPAAAGAAATSPAAADAGKDSTLSGQCASDRRSHLSACSQHTNGWRR